MKTVHEVLDENIDGLVYGNRVLLPFKAELLKIVIESDIITDFSKQFKGAHVRVTDAYTEIYFYDYDSLVEVTTEYEVIKLVLVPDGEDIFDFNNHISIELAMKGKHKVSIEKIGDDILFFE